MDKLGVIMNYLNSKKIGILFFISIFFMVFGGDSVFAKSDDSDGEIPYIKIETEDGTDPTLC